MKSLLFFLSVFFICTSAFADGSDAYKAGDYATAAKEFRAALETAPPSPALYYNLALAEKQSGQPGCAAWSLRRALMLDPSFADAQILLSEIERSQGLPLPATDWRTFVAQRIPLFPLVVASFSFTCIALLLLCFVRTPLPRSIAITMLLVGVAGLVVGTLSDPRILWRKSAVIIATAPPSLTATPIENATALAKIPTATTLTILHKSDSWAYCRLADGREGWLPLAALAPLAP